VDIFKKSLETSLTGSCMDPRAFDCVFMDREMPVMNGVEATRRIVAMQSEALRAVPVIGLSASVENADDWRAAGMTSFLGKPFSRKDLSRVLRLVDARREPEAPTVPHAVTIFKK
jgi:CheY-like chemotaxis protein